MAQPPRCGGNLVMVGMVSASAGEVVDMAELKVADEALIAQELAARAEDPDRDVVELVQAGSLVPALRILMRRHGAAVFRYCREALGDATLAEDVHQQVFIEAHRDLPRFAARSTMRTWLFAIARHRVLDAAKSRRRQQAHLEHDDTADAPDLAPAAGELLDDTRLRDALVACVDKLGEDMRSVMLLRYQLGFTFDEIAEVCGVKPGTLQARVSRALPRLRACIEARTGGRL